MNGVVSSHVKLMINNHNFTVAAMDLVAIVLYITQVLSMGMVQRGDTNHSASDYLYGLYFYS